MLKKNNPFNHLWQHRVVRFGFVGTINTLTDFALLNIFVLGLGTALLVGNTLSASISIFLSYFWNSTIVFQGKHTRSVRLFVKFVLVTGLSVLLVQNLLIYLITHAVSVNVLVYLSGVSETTAHFLQINGAKTIATVGSLLWNFVLYHRFVFKNTRENRLPAQESADPIS